MRADSNRRRVGFSLVEMLLAVFILGIGVISISALFPAGIALQRLATDDVIGPIVAKNAMATLRAKLSQDDFGSFQDFGLANSYLNPGIAGTFNTSGGARLLVPSGDWCWMRPGFIFDNANTPADEGTIDIFSANFTRQQYGLAPFVNLQMANEINEGYSFSAGVERLYGIPYNGRKHPLFTNFTAASALANPLSQRLLEPAVTFTQAERSYPQGPQTYGNSVLPPGKPQYYWDCMFRRSAGRVQVAVFVYRVAAPGGDLRNYSVGRTDPALVGTAPSGSFDAAIDLPPIPLVYYAPTPGTNISWPNRTTTSAGGITTANGYSQFPTADEIPNTHAGTPFGPGRIWDDWMAPGQIWIDQNANVLEVLRGRMVAGAAGSAFPSQGPVKLQRPIPVVPAAPVNGFWIKDPFVAGNAATPPFHAGIGAIWFVPNTDRFGNVITPVYATVEEL